MGEIVMRRGNQTLPVSLMSAEEVRERTFGEWGKEKYWCDRCEKSSVLWLNNCCDFCQRPWGSCPDCGEEVLRPYRMPSGRFNWICPIFCNNEITKIAYMAQQYWKEMEKINPLVIESDDVNHLGIEQDEPRKGWEKFPHYVYACDPAKWIVYRPYAGEVDCVDCLRNKERRFIAKKRN